MAERSSANRSRSAVDNDHPVRLPSVSSPTSTAPSTPSLTSKPDVPSVSYISPARYILPPPCASSVRWCLFLSVCRAYIWFALHKIYFTFLVAPIHMPRGPAPAALPNPLAYSTWITWGNRLARLNLGGGRVGKGDGKEGGGIQKKRTRRAKKK